MSEESNRVFAIDVLADALEARGFGDLVGQLRNVPISGEPRAKVTTILGELRRTLRRAGADDLAKVTRDICEGDIDWSWVEDEEEKELPVIADLEVASEVAELNELTDQITEQLDKIPDLNKEADDRRDDTDDADDSAGEADEGDGRGTEGADTGDGGEDTLADLAG